MNHDNYDTNKLKALQSIASSLKVLANNSKSLPLSPALEDKYEPMSNADKIRKMSNEELAMTIMCPESWNNGTCDTKSCYKCSLEWLRKDVEE